MTPMAIPLPALRRHLDLMPSPIAEAPGLLMRDPFRYSDAVLVLPPPLVPCLLLFDGAHDLADLDALLSRITAGAEVGELSRHVRDSLSAGGFLQDEVYARLRDDRHRAFAAGDRRDAIHAGSAYPADREALEQWAAALLAEGPGRTEESVLGIAAPHVSPEGGRPSYAAAYRALPPSAGERTFVVLGTSHYGAAGRFGLTRKPFATPLGTAAVDLERIDALAADGGPAAVVEDYCHAIEHSIEFQVVFLQKLYGPGVRIVPVLCGPLGAGAGRPHPREDDELGRFLAALQSIGDGATWVLGVDMAHIGRRYGDRAAAVAHQGPLAAVAESDRRRCEAILRGDPEGFWSEVEPDDAGDPLRWCGSAAIYAFLAAARPRRGALLAYEQWNIDPESVVSFGGFAFYR
jgi:AmmeMemoRadiSam system protein B